MCVSPSSVEKTTPLLKYTTGICELQFLTHILTNVGQYIGLAHLLVEVKSKLFSRGVD